MAKGKRATDGELQGRDYVAVVGLRDQAGHRVPPGGSCAEIAVASLGWLLEQGAIAPATKKSEAE